MENQYKITRSKFQINIKKLDRIGYADDPNPSYDWEVIGTTRTAEKHAGKLASEMTDDELIADFIAHPHHYGAIKA